MGTYCCHTEINQYNFQCMGEALTPKVINITKNDLSKLDKKGGPPRIIPVYFLALMFTILIFLPDRVIASEFNPTNLYADISESIVAVIGWDSKKREKALALVP